MRREFLLNIAFLIGINLVIKPFYTFFIETEVQNVVGPEEFGLYFSVFNLSYIFQIFLDLGIHNYGSQYLPKHPETRDHYLSTALFTKALLVVLFAMMIVIIGVLLGYDDRLRGLLYLVSTNQVLIALIFFCRSSLAALGHYRSNSLISVLDKVFMMSALGYALFWNKSLMLSFDVYDFIGIRMGSYALTTGIAGLMLWGVGRFRTLIKVKWSEIRQLLRASLPFAILVVFMGICNRTDAVMLERLLDDGGLQSGIYAAAYRIYYAMSTLGFLFSMLLLPMFSSLLGKDNAELNQLADLSLRTILMLSIGATGVLFVIDDEVMSLLYRSDAELYGTGILTILSITMVLTCVIYVLGTLLTASARLKQLNYVFIIATFVNIGVNIYLIPSIGALGAAWATMLTEILVVTAQYIICIRLTPLRLTRQSLIAIGLYTISTVIACYLIDAVLNPSWPIRMMTMMSITLLVALGSSMLRPYELLRMVKPRD
ncbi:MAG: oligosaccharide flippase family protein [Bacteroidota bacterium]